MALVAWYKLNGNVLDSTVNGNHGIIVGSPTVVSDGPFGTCYLFNPDNNDRITINNLSQFIYNTPFTISAWIKTAGLGTGQTMNGIVTLTYGLRLCANSTGSVYSNLKLSSGSYSLTSVGINVNDNAWHHVCCTYNGDVLKLYIDGNLNISSATGIVQTNTYTNNGAIGLDVNDSSKYKFNGSISDVRIYDEALSLKEIKELSKAKVLHYDFNQFQEPTTNVVTNTNLDTGWTKTYCTGILWNDILPPAGIDSPVVSFYDSNTDKSGYWYSYGDYAPQVPNTIYTVSLYVKTNDSNFNIRFYTADNSETGRYNSEFIYVPNDGSWHRVVWNSFTNSSDSQSSSLSFYFTFNNDQGETQRTWLCAPQMEAKNHATPFVNGTRTGKVYDKSGYNNNAELTVSTTPKYVYDSIIGNGCYEFDGGDYIDTNCKFQYKKVDNFSVSFWINYEDHSLRATCAAGIIGKGHWYDNTWDIWLYNTNKVWFECSGNATRDGRIAINLGGIIETWQHFTVVYNNGLVKGYKNGILISSSTYAGTGDFSNSNDVLLGMRFGDTSRTLMGKLADVRIYSTALSEDDIKEIYQTRASIDKNGNLYCNSISNGEMIWDSEINSINLVTNGSAELENNTNFTSFNYITTDSYDGAGCLSRTGAGTLYSNEYIKIDKYNGSYYLSGYFKSAGTSGLNSRLYFGIACFDYLKRLINVDMVCHYTNTETTLAQPLNNGDTIVYLTSASNWHTSASSNSTRKLGVYYNEIDVYPKYTYTRSTVYYTEADLINNTITLTTAWSGGNVPSGTAVANHYNSGTYQYIAAIYASVPFTWTKYINSNAISGWSINDSYSYFRYGTEYIKLLFLSNYGQDSTYTTLMDNLKFWNTKAENKVVNINIEKTSNIVATEFSEVGITDGLVAYYPLNGDAKDYSGNSNHGTVYGAIKASGINNKKCYYFDAVDDYIQLPSDLGYTTAFTACAWFKSLGTPTGGYHIIFGGSQLEISVPTAGSLRIGLNTSIRYVNDYGSGLTDGNWHHVCMTFDGTKKRGYINGSLVGEADVEGTLVYSFNRTIGRYGTSTVYYTNGLIQDVRIYNRALSDKEIGILYNTFNPNINKTLQINKENVIYTKGNIKEV